MKIEKRFSHRCHRLSQIFDISTQHPCDVDDNGFLLLHLFYTPPESLFFIHIYHKRYPLYYQRFIHL